MAGKTRERFNVWAAYVDLFSNMLAFIMMIGLIAATSGGALSGSRHACASMRSSSNQGLMADVDSLADRAGMAGADLDVGPNCEVPLFPAPADQSGAWRDLSGFMVFPKGLSTFCWKKRNLKCPPLNIADPQGDMNKLCDALKTLLDEIADIEQDPDDPTGYRVAIVGHTSDDWAGDEYDRCTNSMLSKAKGDRDEAALLCNYQLSLERAQSAAAYCEDQRWHKKRYAYLILGGEAFMDSRLGGQAGGPPEYQRRITISVFLPEEGTN